ncbi:hypothetical protein A2U01_0115190, partial [Trifolium medium]|nr:hypothetical protein [Trifolium medium]
RAKVNSLEAAVREHSNPASLSKDLAEDRQSLSNKEKKLVDLEDEKFGAELKPPKTLEDTTNLAVECFE